MNINYLQLKCQNYSTKNNDFVLLNNSSACMLISLPK